MTSRLTRQGIAAKAAVADVPGAAWAVARYGAGGVVPTGRTMDAVESLSIRSLRIAAGKLSALHQLGIERVSQLAARPRALLVRRFGRDVADGDRTRQREGWPAGDNPPAPRHLNEVTVDAGGEPKQQEDATQPDRRRH